MCRVHVSFRLWCASAPYRTQFSFRVLPAYNYTCALTRYRMIAINGTTALDAAHIRQFKKGGSNHPTNGIALSKTAPWLIDHGFWSISHDFRVIVAANHFEEAGEDAFLLCHALTKERAIPLADLVRAKTRKATGR